jgi:hypothetical protein
MTASDPVFKPVTLPDFQNGNDKELQSSARLEKFARPKRAQRRKGSCRRFDIFP